MAGVENCGGGNEISRGRYLQKKKTFRTMEIERLNEEAIHLNTL